MADIAQIQIVPVDNGFFIQCINADGSGSLNPRRVATNREDLVGQIKEIAETLYSKEPPTPNIAAAVATAVGPPDTTPSEGTAPKV